MEKWNEKARGPEANASGTGATSSKARLGGWNLLVVVIMLLVCGCKQVEYVEVPVDRIREVMVDCQKTDTVRDSVYNNVYVKEYLKGDTVYRDSIDIRYKWKTQVKVEYRDSIRVDTITKIVLTERKLTKWEQTAVDWFGTLVKTLLAVLAMIIVVIVVKVRKVMEK